jgi:archaellum biogenesis protein FlaJ (TadC family)
LRFGFVNEHTHEIIAILLTLMMVLATCSLVVFLVLRYLARSRELLSLERRAAIEKGLDAPLDLGVRPRRVLWNPLKTAVLLIGLGVAISVVLAGENEWVAGLFVIIIGLANLAYYRLGGKREWEREVALREELHRAYLRRLSGGASPAEQGAPGEGERL